MTGQKYKVSLSVKLLDDRPASRPGSQPQVHRPGLLFGMGFVPPMAGVASVNALPRLRVGVRLTLQNAQRVNEGVLGPLGTPFPQAPALLSIPQVLLGC